MKNMAHTYNRKLFSFKIEGNWTEAATQMSREDITLSEIHQADTQKDNYCAIRLL